jgi:hypothetical protein
LFTYVDDAVVRGEHDRFPEAANPVIDRLDRTTTKRAARSAARHAGATNRRAKGSSNSLVGAGLADSSP